MFRVVTLARTASAVATRTATATPRVALASNIPQFNARHLSSWFGGEKKDEATEKKEGEEAAPATEEQPAVEKDEKDLKIEKLEEDLKNLKDQLLRSLADAENTRRIAAKDIENARSYGNSSFAKAMIDVADDLERAIQTAPEDEKKVLYSGIQLVEKNLFKSLKKFGVEPFGQVNDKFDPNLHEALFRIPDTTNEANTLGQVVKKGYMIKDRVLRAAQVGARYNPEQE